jgi:hypothetical protein
MGRMMPTDDNAVNKEMTAMSSGVYDPLYEAGEQAYGNTLRQPEQPGGSGLASCLAPEAGSKT